jgi:hypothetical protein
MKVLKEGFRYGKKENVFFRNSIKSDKTTGEVKLKGFFKKFISN